ncbi:MAG: copper chaperone Copz family protein [Chitinophagaceae bacterium]|nr:copper chaperone Copz family protein [Anaerolineae bacterium]
MSMSIGICPITQTVGKRVDNATLKSMLAVSLYEVQDVDYFFCPESNCEVVYFSTDGKQVFKTHEVRERVFQKEPDSPDVLICYCFRHTPGTILAEIENTGGSTVVEDINRGIKAGQCACDWRNPQGDCCLGNVSRFIKKYRSGQ